MNTIYTIQQCQQTQIQNKKGGIYLKNGKNPTREQRKLMEEFGLNSKDWLVVKNTPTELVVVNRNSNEEQSFSK